MRTSAAIIEEINGLLSGLPPDLSGKILGYVIRAKLAESIRVGDSAQQAEIVIDGFATAAKAGARLMLPPEEKVSQ